jgi:ethanolaminephosphotransferase
LTGVSSTIFLAILNRIMRRWNQTGQKFAGESDIAHGFLSSRPKFLWALILLTYVASFWGLARSSPIKSKAWLSIWTTFCASLSIAAIFFKVSFAAADSPELLNEWMLKVVETGSSFSLVLQARVVFLGIFVLFFILTWANSTFGQKRSGMTIPEMPSSS